MRTVVLGTSALLAALTLAGGCNRKPVATAPASNDSASDDANNAISEDKTVNPADAAFAAAAADATTNDTGNLVARKPGQPLSVYVGHSPSETIGGTDFRDDPVVKKAVTEAVADREIRDFVLNSSDVESPIKVKDGKIFAAGCQAHDCGAHHWTISIAPDGSNAEVCYFNSENPETGIAKHFFPRRRLVEKRGDCPSPAV